MRHSWLRQLIGLTPRATRATGKPRQGRIKQQKGRSRPTVELLEDRTLLSATLVRDINPTEHGSYAYNMTDVNGTLFFMAYDDVHGMELWKSNGTAASTVLVKDIKPGSAGSDSPYYTATMNGLLYFAADDGVHGFELWKSDGTAAGTVMVKDIFPGAVGSTPIYLENLNGTIYFAAFHLDYGTELWKSDGTAAGTVMVKDLNPGMASSSPLDMVYLNGTVLFYATDGTSGYELWRTNGTAASTVLVKDIFAGSGSSYPYYLTVVNNVAIFSAFDATGGNELWRSDGTTAGTYRIKDINPGLGDSAPTGMLNVNGILYFEADDGVHGEELWKSDGTMAGTVLLKDINPGPGDGEPYYMTNLNGVVIFQADDGATGFEIWRTDGTTAGTVLLKDINPGIAGSQPTVLINFVTVNGLVYFSAQDARGFELWQTDGTADGTRLTLDINPGAGSSNPLNLVNVNGTLFFAANDGVRGMELWKVAPTSASSLSFSAPSYTISENGGSAIITVNRTNGSVGTVSVDYTVSSGTATAGSDYTAISGTLTFASGQTSRTFVLPIMDDTLHEGNETLSLTLSNPVGASLGSPTLALLTINDNDRLRVTSVTATATGFVAQFNGPFDGALINLYDSQAGSLGPTDVTLIGANNGAVAGSVVIDAVNQRVTFIRTGGVLSVDNYTARFRSATNGFRSTVTGELLDGNNDGIAGGDSVDAFAVGASSAIAVSIPDFMRGPGQPVDVPATGTGLPLRLSASAGVTSVEVTLRFNPNLLTITAATVAQGVPEGATVSLNTSTPGTALITFTTPVLGAGITDFVILTADVPSSAGMLYTQHQILDLTNLSINGGALAGIDDDGLHVNAYLGDVTANGKYSSADALAVLHVAAGRASGFAAYPQVDPVILADITGDGRVSSIDATRILQKGVGIEAGLIPNLPLIAPVIVVPTRS